MGKTCKPIYEDLPACTIKVPPVVQRIKHAMRHGQNDLAKAIIKQHEDEAEIVVNYIQSPTGPSWQVMVTPHISGLTDIY